MNDTASGILNAALSLPQAIQRLKISSDKLFVSAQDCFKESRKAATHAFNNKSLSIKDRIMACKLRVAARILETGLEHPEAAVTACLLSLEELHGLPAIQEMFAVFLKGGLKAMVKKAERFENIMSVLLINHALYDFASKYSSQSLNPFTWPGIELKDCSFHPILHAHEIVKKMPSSEEFLQVLQQLDRVIFDSGIRRADFVVNSRGEIIVLDDDKIRVIYRTGESKDIKLPNITESDSENKNKQDVAVDSNDNVYAVIEYTIRGFALYAFDKNYNIKHVSVLDFLDKTTKYPCITITVDKNQNLIMHTNWNGQVYICESTGKLKSQFKRDRHLGGLRGLSISNNNDIIIVSDPTSFSSWSWDEIVSDDGGTVKLYSTEGNLKSTIKVPKCHEVKNVAFYHGICKIIVLAHDWEQDSMYLLSYSETGKLEKSVFLCAPAEYTGIKSHPSGTFVVQVNDSITLL